MDFFRKIKESIYGPKFYQELLAKPMGYSVKYFLGFALVFALLFTVKLSITHIPSMNRYLAEFSQKTVELFPAELEVNIKNGALSTNVEEPYYVKTPKELQDGDRQERMAANLIVIDTKNDANIENFKNYDTLVLLTKNYVIYEKDDMQIISQPLENLPDTAVNKVVVKDFVEKATPYLKIFAPFIVVMFFICGFFLVLFKAIYLVFGALVVWLVARAKGIDVGYPKAYQLGLHLMTLPILLVSLASLRFFFAFTLLLAVMAALNIMKEEVKEEEVVPVDDVFDSGAEKDYN